MFRPFALASTILVLSTAAHAAGDVAAGKKVAHAVCAQCHDVSDDPRPLPRREKGMPPAFIAVAQDPALTDERLREFLHLPHGEMDHLLITRKDADDVTAYVLSLRRH